MVPMLLGYACAPLNGSRPVREAADVPGGRSTTP